MSEQITLDEAVATSIGWLSSLPGGDRINVKSVAPMWLDVFQRNRVRPEELIEATKIAGGRLKWFPAPVEVLEIVHEILAEKWKDSIGIEGPDGRLRLVPVDSLEALTVAADRQAAIDGSDPLVIEAQKDRIRELAPGIAEGKRL